MKTFKQLLAEISKKTLGSYVTKASEDAVDKAGEVESDTSSPGECALKRDKRLNGIKTAADRLSKEEVEQVEESRKDEGDKNANSYRSNHGHSAVKELGSKQKSDKERSKYNGWKNFERTTLPNGTKGWTMKKKHRDKFAP